MKTKRFTNSLRNYNDKYTPIERKLAEYKQDPRRLYDGHRDEDAFLNAVGSIKAVRLG